VVLNWFCCCLAKEGTTTTRTLLVGIPVFLQQPRENTRLMEDGPFAVTMRRFNNILSMDELQKTNGAFRRIRIVVVVVVAVVVALAVALTVVVVVVAAAVVVVVAAAAAAAV